VNDNDKYVRPYSTSFLRSEARHLADLLITAVPELRHERKWLESYLRKYPELITESDLDQVADHLQRYANVQSERWKDHNWTISRHGGELSRAVFV
jgi:hypothetical protein